MLGVERVVFACSEVGSGVGSSIPEGEVVACDCTKTGSMVLCADW